MARHTWFLLLLALGVASAAPLWADIGPRPPLTEREVSNPQEYLVMKAEDVKVTLAGKAAHVVATFHFESIPLRRALLKMRVGFPRLRADQPYRNFKVLQSVDGSGTFGKSDRQAVETDRDPNPLFSAGLDADWFAWPVRLRGSNGAPMACRVDAQVSYDQDLTPIKGSRNSRFTYVLRSGAPWKESIGKATITVTADKPRIVSATPVGGVRQGNGLTWSLAEFEPTQDVVVVVKP